MTCSVCGTELTGQEKTKGLCDFCSSHDRDVPDYELLDSLTEEEEYDLEDDQ